MITDHHTILLVDNGSIHNFIQQQLVTQLGLPYRETTPLRVMVGNGQHLECNCLCEAVIIDIQTTKFTVDLYVLPISGANVVLGVQWLKSLGPILSNYNTLCMQFFHEGRLVELRGDNDANLGLLTPPQLRHLCRKQDNALYFHIAVFSDSNPPSANTDPPLEIQALLTKFGSLFQNPQALPPTRDTDHHIHLILHSTSVNVHHYCYPYYQKHEIKLQKGLIQPSTSPFSLPVLLVKKHDGSWRFCVDYHTLNALKVRDRFPIPTIDEFLDELGGARCFSKLDLL